MHLKEVENLVKRMDVKPSKKMRQRILNGILKVPNKTDETATPAPSVKGKTVHRKNIILIIISFLVAMRAALIRAAAVRTVTVGATALVVLVSTGTIVYKTVVANPKLLPSQESTIPCESSSSDRIGLQADNKVEVEGIAIGYSVTAKLLLGDNTKYGFSALDNAQFNIFASSITTDIFTFDNSQTHLFDGLIDRGLMAWGSDEFILSYDVINDDLEILSNSFLTTDGNLLEYDFDEIYNVKSVLKNLWANGDTIADRSSLNYDVSTDFLPTPSSIFLLASGLLTVVSIRRRLR